MRIRALILGLLSLLVVTAAHARDFSEGQVWSYKTRTGEEKSTLLIDKVEKDPKLGLIFHISLSGVSVKNRRTTSGVTHELPHLPVSKQTLEASCVKLVGEAKPNPAYLEGYAEWKRAFDQGRAGVFTIPVSEIVGAVETVMNK